MQVKESHKIISLFEKLVSTEYHYFPEKGKMNVTEKHGVYIIYSPKDEVLHVGNTPSGRNGLNQRLYNGLAI